MTSKSSYVDHRCREKPHIFWSAYSKMWVAGISLGAQFTPRTVAQYEVAEDFVRRLNATANPLGGKHEQG